LAYATDGIRQVGIGVPAPGISHALVWSGTAESAVDLHPTILEGFENSVARGVAGNQQVGEGESTPGRTHALMWTGTPDSAVDLHPTTLSGFVTSTAYDTNGQHQVGVARGAAGNHAMLWTGNAESAVDLHLLLPNEWVSSRAFSIDSQSTAFGLATDGTGALHAIKWVVVPEPPAIIFTIISVFCATHLARHVTLRLH
jgi:hypothetical protein